MAGRQSGGEEALLRTLPRNLIASELSYETIVHTHGGAQYVAMAHSSVLLRLNNNVCTFHSTHRNVIFPGKSQTNETNHAYLYILDMSVSVCVTPH